MLDPTTFTDVLMDEWKRDANGNPILDQLTNSFLKESEPRARIDPLTNEPYKDPRTGVKSNSGQPTIYIGFQQRDLPWKCLYIIYRVLRVVEVSFWFYFAPFVALFGSYGFPYLLSYKMQQDIADISTPTDASQISHTEGTLMAVFVMVGIPSVVLALYWLYGRIFGYKTVEADNNVVNERINKGA